MPLTAMDGVHCSVGIDHAGNLDDCRRRHRRAVVVHAVAGRRPAVVLALLDHVQLVAAARAVLARPQRAGRRIDVEALRVAVAVAPDRLHGARRVHERVVLRRRAVVVDAMDLAVRALQVLRRVEVAAVADRVVEELVLVEEEPGAEVGVVGPVEILRGLEQRLLLDEGAVLDLAADDARGRRALGGAAGLAEREVEPAGAARSPDGGRCPSARRPGAPRSAAAR